ncbi:hypothetical protein OG21DRAFT_1527142 [Imleria badia]|nr:hypothetical protein OG21DRAFT_1527142 [Imleria badia]
MSFAQGIVNEALAAFREVLKMKVAGLLPPKKTRIEAWTEAVGDLRDHLELIRSVFDEAESVPPYMIACDIELSLLGNARWPNWDTIRCGDISRQPDHPWVSKMVRPSTTTQSSSASPAGTSQVATSDVGGNDTPEARLVDGNEDHIAMETKGKGSRDDSKGKGKGKAKESPAEVEETMPKPVKIKAKRAKSRAPDGPISDVADSHQDKETSDRSCKHVVPAESGSKVKARTTPSTPAASTSAINTSAVSPPAQPPTKRQRKQLEITDTPGPSKKIYIKPSNKSYDQGSGKPAQVFAGVYITHKGMGGHIIPSLESTPSGTPSPVEPSDGASEAVGPDSDSVSEVIRALQTRNDELEHQVQALETGLTTFGEVINGLFPELGNSELHFPFESNSEEMPPEAPAPSSPPMANRSPLFSPATTPRAISAPIHYGPVSTMIGPSSQHLMILGTTPETLATGWPCPDERASEVVRCRSTTPSSEAAAELPENHFKVLSDEGADADHDMNEGLPGSKPMEVDEGAGNSE